VLQRLPAGATSLVRGAARAERLRRFAALVAWLPAADRELLRLRGIEGRAHAAVAAHFGIGADAAEMRWRRLLVRLRADWGSAGLAPAD
jgi:DNA-directed RNA polymerase specialized sigma24 family protein